MDGMAFVVYCGDRIFTLDNICIVDFVRNEEDIHSTDIIFYKEYKNEKDKIIRTPLARLQMIESKKKLVKGVAKLFLKVRLKKLVRLCLIRCLWAL